MGKCNQGKDNSLVPGIKTCKINGMGCELSERDDSDKCPIFTEYHLRIEGKK